MCLFLGIFITGIFAQDIPPQPVLEGTGSTSWYGDYIIWEDVFCNGEYVESFTGPMVWHNISHFVNGVEVWETSQAIGELTSTSGEVFHVNEIVRQSYSDDLITWHGNLKGNMGSHYVYSFTSSLDWTSITIEKTGCPGNKK